MRQSNSIQYMIVFNFSYEDQGFAQQFQLLFYLSDLKAAYVIYLIDFLLFHQKFLTIDEAMAF